MLKYAFKVEGKDMAENMAMAFGRDLSISTKHSTEICNEIRGKPLQKAKNFLERVLKKESAVKIRRYTGDRAHRQGVGPGRYPVKAVEEILNVIKSAEANAQNKGLSTSDMIVLHISAHKAARPWHFGRKRRRKTKRSHIQVVLLEVKEKKQHTAKEEIKK